MLWVITYDSIARSTDQSQRCVECCKTGVISLIDPSTFIINRSKSKAERRCMNKYLTFPISSILSTMAIACTKLCELVHLKFTNSWTQTIIWAQINFEQISPPLLDKQNPRMWPLEDVTHGQGQGCNWQNDQIVKKDDYLRKVEPVIWMLATVDCSTVSKLSNYQEQWPALIGDEVDNGEVKVGSIQLAVKCLVLQDHLVISAGILGQFLSLL